MRIRRAERSDLPELLAIYNYEVEHGTATFDLHPKTEEEWESWFDAHSDPHHPLIVAESGGKTVGYASLSVYRPKEAYRSTAELSIYVDVHNRRQGTAAALMEAILDIARQDDALHLIVSIITEGNDASIRLHEKFRFVHCGRVNEVGYKFGAYRGIDYYSLRV